MGQCGSEESRSNGAGPTDEGPKDPNSIEVDGARITGLTPEHHKLVRSLVRVGQRHIFTGGDDDTRSSLIPFLQRLDAAVPGGLLDYTARAQRLLANSKTGANPMEGCTPAVPEGRRLTIGDAEFLQFEQTGLAAAADTVFVLVAGGLGERLGYSGIKVALPTESVTGKCYLQLYAEQILAMQGLAGNERPIPLIIMTSGDTDAATRALLKQNGNFGLSDEQVTIVKQEKVPCLADNSAAFVLSDDRRALLLKPHGHGDVHALLHRQGIADRMLQRGLRYIVFFQDTNGLAFNGLPAALGVSSAAGLHLNFVSVQRKAGDACGALMRLSKRDGSAATVNVEYNHVDALLRGAGQAGDVGDAEGWSAFPGNTNQLIFDLPAYCAALARTAGLVPEFVNPKYADGAKERFKAPTRLECMMQDFAALLPPDSPVGFTAVEGALAYCPVKSNRPDAIRKAAEGLPPASLSAGEMALYHANAHKLSNAGMDVEVGPEVDLGGLSFPRAPLISLAAAFAPAYGAVMDKVRGGWVSQRSSLVLEAANVRIDDVELDGALVVKAVPEAAVRIKHLKVQNAGWTLDAPGGEAGLGEVDRMRGYVLHKRETKLLEFTEAGTYEVEGDAIRKTS